MLHLNVAVKRLRLGVNIHNPYTEKIKSSFKQALLSVNLLKKIEEQFLVRFDDDEIAYVTLHIQSFLDRYRPNKSEVLLVCSSGYGTSKLLEQRINRTIRFFIHWSIFLQIIKNALKNALNLSHLFFPKDWWSPMSRENRISLSDWSRNMEVSFNILRISLLCHINDLYPLYQWVERD